LLHLRYFEWLSQPQIAEEIGISTIHVSRLTRRALLKLRDEIGPMQSPPSFPEAIAG
jgi:RNA polymerase sigma-B factor